MCIPSNNEANKRGDIHNSYCLCLILFYGLFVPYGLKIFGNKTKLVVKVIINVTL